MAFAFVINTSPNKFHVCFQLNSEEMKQIKIKIKKINDMVREIQKNNARSLACIESNKKKQIKSNFREIASNDRAFEMQPKNTIITEKAVNIHR